MKKLFYSIAIFTVFATNTPLSSMIPPQNPKQITIKGKSATLFDHIACALTSNNKEYFGEKIVFYNYTKINDRMVSTEEIKEGFNVLSEEQLEHIKNGNYLYIPAYVIQSSREEINIPLTIIIGTKEEEIKIRFKICEKLKHTKP